MLEKNQIKNAPLGPGATISKQKYGAYNSDAKELSPIYVGEAIGLSGLLEKFGAKPEIKWE